MGDIKISTDMTFAAREIFLCIDRAYGKACGAKQLGCSDYTKAMIIHPIPDTQENFLKLKDELSAKLDEMGGPTDGS